MVAKWLLTGPIHKKTVSDFLISLIWLRSPFGVICSICHTLYCLPGENCMSDYFEKFNRIRLLRSLTHKSCEQW